MGQSRGVGPGREEAGVVSPCWGVYGAGRVNPADQAAAHTSNSGGRPRWCSKHRFGS